MKSEIEFGVLYRTPNGWRFSVRERPTAMACGRLHEVAAEVDSDLALRAFEAHLRTHWTVEGTAHWQQTDSDWWQVRFE